MKTISLAVLESSYEDFRQAARAQNRSTAQLIREAMELYSLERLHHRGPLSELPVLPGHKLVAELPRRADIYSEIFQERGPESP